MIEQWAESYGPYRVLGELGRGAMGVVLRVRRDDLEREYALKLIRAGLDATPEAIERFRREARAAAQLAGHPGIVGVHDVGEAHGSVYFAMDLVEGSALDDYTAECERSPNEIAQIIADAARAVHHAHTFGLLHRDVKPANIMVSASGTAMLTDFGLVKTEHEPPDSQGLTHSGMIVGTPAFMSPEQAQGNALDARSDVWSLGATLYFCITGFQPFDGQTILHVLSLIMTEDVLPPRKLTRQCPRDLETIILKCLSREVDDRYANAQDLADDLDRFVAGDPILAKPLGWLGKLQRHVRRNRPLYGLGAAAALVVAAVAAWFGFQRAQEQARSEAQSEANIASAVALVTKLTDAAPAQAMGAVRQLEALAPDHPGLAALRTAARRAAARDQVRQHLERVGLFADEADRLRAEWEEHHRRRLEEHVPPDQAWLESFSSARSLYTAALRVLGQDVSAAMEERLTHGLAQLAADRLHWAERTGDLAGAARFRQELQRYGGGDPGPAAGGK